ncbi:MAG: amidohydrolase family protein, partial [Burkholderiales bacterium]|nr:amidohydrolase family protein [Burkholderiales bacterium]
AVDGGGYPVQICDAAYSGRTAQCAISGAGAKLQLRANVISGGTLYVGGRLLVGADGRVEAAGCAVPDGPAVLLDCPGALVSAGFINLHEHIDYSFQQPPRPPVLKWAHRNEWRRLSAAERGFEGDAPTDAQVRTEVSERAMLRHALNGSTAVSGAKDYRAFLRNLKLPEPPLATPFGKPVLDNTFPVGDAASMQPLQAACSLDQITAIRLSRDNPFIPHVGEGTSDAARYEVDCVLDAIITKATPSAFIHGVAISADQVKRLKSQGVAVVLSPRSNLQLYGATAPVAELKAAGVTLAMGTDWSPSGSLTMLDEARCLARYDRDRLGGRLSASDLHRMLTENGARAVGLQGQVGTLAPGEWADIVLIDTEGRRALGDILAASALKQTLAVFIAGRAANLPASWAGQLPQLDGCAPDPRDLCGVQRVVCGANAQRPLAQLLRQSVYTIDDAKTCAPQPTDDCVVR